MIEENAQVIEIQGNRLLLQVQRQSACGSCSASRGCGTSLLSKVVGQKFSRFQADNSVNAAIGDTVVVAVAEDALIKGSVVMYIVPILGMFIFALLADYLLSATMQYRDLIIAATAIAGLLAGSFFAKRYFAFYSGTQLYTPVVLRKIVSHN